MRERGGGVPSRSPLPAGFLARPSGVQGPQRGGRFDLGTPLLTLHRAKRAGGKPCPMTSSRVKTPSKIGHRPRRPRPTRMLGRHSSAVGLWWATTLDHRPVVVNSQPVVGHHQLPARQCLPVKPAAHRVCSLDTSSIPTSPPHRSVRPGVGGPRGLVRGFLPQRRNNTLVPVGLLGPQRREDSSAGQCIHELLLAAEQRAVVVLLRGPVSKRKEECRR